MIRYLKNNEIDLKKYDACIQTALNSRIYAFSWYLNCVADNWDVLVLNDYEAVMPLPWRQKYFIKYIYPPAWTQQLGVFSSTEVNELLIAEFVNSIPKKFKKITIQFNSQNNVSFIKTEKRINYVLDLNKPYEEIHKGFNKNRKRIIKNGLSLTYTINKNIDTVEFLDFYLDEPKKFQLKQHQITTLKNVLNSNNKAVNVWGISEDEKLIAGLVWLKDDKRITYLLPITTKQGKEKGLQTLLISKIIEKHQKSNLFLDFEGSMIKGVADFYKSFGGIPETYLQCKRFRL